MQSSGFFDATRYLGRGWQLVRTPGLRRFVWVPLMINVLVFVGLGWLLFGSITSWLDSLSVFERFGDFWLFSALESLLRFLLGVVLAIVLGYSFTLLANIIGAPFNGLLAERVEAHLTGQPPGQEPTLLFLLKSVPKTLWSEISKLIYLSLWLIPLIIAHFIPGLNVLAPLLLFLFGAWMFALEYVDYPMGNHGNGFRAVKRKLKSHRRIALGFGLVVAIASIIPLVNLVVMPVAVAGATALYVERLQ